MPQIQAGHIQQRTAYLQAEIDKVEAERRECMERLERLNTRGIHLLGQKAETEFWGKLLEADEVAEAEG